MFRLFLKDTVVNNKLILLLMHITLMYGCAHVAEEYEADPIFDNYSDLYPEGSKTVSSDELKKRIDDAEDNVARNNLIMELATISNYVCATHQAEIIANANSWNIATGTSTNIFSALGTFIGGATTKAALAAGSAVSNSSRSLVNEEIYLKQYSTTIVRAVTVAREDYFNTILNSMDKSIDDYTISQAILDIQEYHKRCSFFYGIVELSNALNEREKTKNEIENEIKWLQAQREDNSANKKITDDIDNQLIELIRMQREAPN